jgi:hypothetical protein
MFYDELDAAQKADWERKAKEKKERTKVRIFLFNFSNIQTKFD